MTPITLPAHVSMFTGLYPPRHGIRDNELWSLSAEADTLAERAAGNVFRIERLQLGMTAPNFTTADVDGVQFELSDYRGKVVLLDFWGFW